jgi:hypothetical protein
MFEPEQMKTMGRVMLEQAKTVLITDGTVAPMVYLMRATAEGTAAVTLITPGHGLGDAAARSAFANAVKRQIREYGGDAVFMAEDCWITQVDKNASQAELAAARAIRPSLNPKRLEAIVLSMQTRTHYARWVAVYRRNPDNTPLFEDEPGYIDDVRARSGPFDNWFDGPTEPG